MTNNHQATINNSRALGMFQSGQGADCLIEVVPQIDGQDKQEFNVHKFVLMVNSDVFMAMFSHDNTREALEGRIQITDSTATAVRQMLIYMYTGTGELPTEYAIETDAGPLLYIANKYQIQSLVQLIGQELINSVSLQNVLDRLELADLYQVQSLYSSCGQWVRRNLKIVKKDAKWLELLKNKAPELALELSKRFRNVDGNAWCSGGRFDAGLTISDCGLNASNPNEFQYSYAEKGFPLSVANCRMDGFPGTICYYYEVTILILKSAPWYAVGLTDEEILPDQWIGGSSNSYAILIPNPHGNIYQFNLAGQSHLFGLPKGVKMKETGNVIGCGILMDPNDKFTIFFTLNGILADRQFPIDPTVDYLFPTVTLWDEMSSIEANFGDNPAKPFAYDIQKCPGMGLEWI